MTRNLFSFIWDMTHWNRLDIKNTTGGKPNKQKYKFIFGTLKKIGSLGVYNAMHNNRLNQSASHYQWWNGLTWDRYMHGIDQISKLSFFSRGYTYWVMIEWLYCTVTFCAHCICAKRQQINHYNFQIGKVFFLSCKLFPKFKNWIWFVFCGVALTPFKLI